MGESGSATGPHLHFAVADTPYGNYSSNPPGQFIDPEIYLNTAIEGGGGSSPTPRPRPAKGAAGLVTPSQHKYEKKGALNGMTYYQVKSGDSLSAIAAKHGVDMNDILLVEYANIPNKNKILKNQVLLLPKAAKVAATPKPARAKTHKVRPGENLSVIAKKYGTTVDRLAKSNGIKNKNVIYVGQVLKV